MNRTRTRNVLGLVLALTICFAAAGLGTSWSMLGLAQWYGTLAKPSFTPPNRVFGPVWTVLYTMMAVAAWRVWREGPPARVAAPLALFGLQLALNVAWSGLFFTLRSPGLALLDIAALWLALAATLAVFWRIDRPAGVLLVPYLAWVTFASALNFAIWRLNP